MRRMNMVCIDRQTKREIILEDCSYNNACYFLERENRDNRFGHFKGIVMNTATRNLTEIRYEKARFLYDESRGYLLRAN